MSLEVFFLAVTVFRVILFLADGVTVHRAAGRSASLGRIGRGLSADFQLFVAAEHI